MEEKQPQQQPIKPNEVDRFKQELKIIQQIRKFLTLHVKIGPKEAQQLADCDRYLDITCNLLQNAIRDSKADAKK